jgi:thiaminase
VAAKAPRPDWTAFFCQCARGAYQVETSFHKELLAHFGTTAAAACAGAAPCPASLLYTSWLLATVHGRAFYEGLAAVLPCFIVYLEVGRALLQRGARGAAPCEWGTALAVMCVWGRVSGGGGGGGRGQGRGKGGPGARLALVREVKRCGVQPLACVAALFRPLISYPAARPHMLLIVPCHAAPLPIVSAGSPHPLYQQWLDQYGGAEFEGLVLQVVAVANEVAAELGPVQVTPCPLLLPLPPQRF